MRFRELIESVTPEGRRTRIVAIDGCGGSGKSEFAAELARVVPNATHQEHPKSIQRFFR